MKRGYCKVKEIGIITIVDNQNYGNRLQNFALSFFVQKNINVVVVTIKNRGFEDYTYIKDWNKTRGENCLKQTRVGDWLIRIIRKKRDKKKSFYHLVEKREKKFDDFNRKYMKFTTYELCSNRWKYKKLK